jgi:hypothetical protein
VLLCTRRYVRQSKSNEIPQKPQKIPSLPEYGPAKEHTDGEASSYILRYPC